MHATPATRSSTRTTPSPVTTTATRRAHPWGRCRSDATRLHPRLAWHLLTDAQVDVLYLADPAFGSEHLKQREVAERYGVTTPTVNRHLRAARRALERAGREAALAADSAADDAAAAGGRVACLACDTPGVSCLECIEETFFRPKTTMLPMRHGWGARPRRRQVPIDRVAAAELPHLEDVNAPAHGRAPRLMRNAECKDANRRTY